MSAESRDPRVVMAITEKARQEIFSSQHPAEALTSISFRHLEQLGGVAKAMEVPLILRAVNPDAFPLLKEGAVGKNMAVHGKSSEDRMLAAYIPVRACISKAGKRKDIIKITQANSENSKALEHSFQRIETYKAHAASHAADPRNLSALNIEFEEMKKKAVLSAPLCTHNGEQIYIFENSRGLARQEEKEGIKETVFAIKDGESFYSIDANHIIEKKLDITGEYTPTVVKVFVKPTFTKDGNITHITPLTADIDVLAYGSRMNDLGHNTYALRDVEDMIGQGPNVLKSLVKDVIGPLIGRDLISHGPEQYNIDYVQPLEPPWVVVESNRVKMISSEHELIGVFNQFSPMSRIIEGGHIKPTSIEPNPHWGWEFNKATKSYNINNTLKKTFRNVDHVISSLRESDDIRDKELAQQLIEEKVTVGLAYLNPAEKAEMLAHKKSSLDKKITHYSPDIALDLEFAEQKRSDEAAKSVVRKPELNPYHQGKENARRDRSSSIFSSPAPATEVTIVPDEEMRNAVDKKMKEYRGIGEAVVALSSALVPTTTSASPRRAEASRSVMPTTTTTTDVNEYHIRQKEAKANKEKNTKSSFRLG